MTKFIEVITTFETLDEARKMAKLIVENKFGACCSIQEIESLYRWKDNIGTAKEFQLTIKTAEKLYSNLEAFILNNHSYETPQILSLPILAGSKLYMKWLYEATK